MKILYFCSRCGEEIREGDTAYRLLNHIFCPGCVENARIIAHVPEEAFHFRYPRRGSTITGFPAGIPCKSRKNP